jgi:hypothetical protein
MSGPRKTVAATKPMALRIDHHDFERISGVHMACMKVSPGKQGKMLDQTRVPS